MAFFIFRKKEKIGVIKMVRKKTCISNGKKFTLLRGFRIKEELEERKKIAKNQGYQVLSKQIGKYEWLLYVYPEPR